MKLLKWSVIRLVLLMMSISGCTNLLYGQPDLELLPPQFTVPLHGDRGSFKVDLLRSRPFSCVSFKAPWDEKATIIVSKKLLEQIVILGDKSPMEWTNNHRNDLLARDAKKILRETLSGRDPFGCEEIHDRLTWTFDISYLGMALFQSGQVAVSIADFEGFVPYVKINYHSSSHDGSIRIWLPPEYGERPKGFSRTIISDHWWTS